MELTPTTLLLGEAQTQERGQRRRAGPTCSRAGAQPVGRRAPAGYEGRWLEGPIRRSPPVTTGLRGGRKGDMGGSQGLLRVSFEALHSDIDQGVVGAGGQGRGLHWADRHLIDHDLVAVGTQQGAGRVALGDGGERQQCEGGRGVSKQQHGLFLLEELPGWGAGAPTRTAGPLKKTFSPFLLLPGWWLRLLWERQLALASFQQVKP